MKLANHSVNEITTSSINYQQAAQLDVIGARKMWPLATGKSTIVAIIDTGLDRNHPDFQGKICGGACFVPGLGIDNWDDDNSHGTHVAGIIAAVAPDAKLLPIKALDGKGNGSLNNVIKGIEFCINYRLNAQKVDVINLSLGSPQNDPKLHDVIKRATAAGILVCCAAGNSGDGNATTSECDYPAMYQEVVSVGAIDLTEKVCQFSNTNSEVDLAAPGGNIWSTLPGNRYGNMSGTSMACPHVAGMAALYIEKYGRRFNKRPSEMELYLALKMLSKDIGVPGTDPDTGAGVVNAWI